VSGIGGKPVKPAQLNDGLYLLVHLDASVSTVGEACVHEAKFLRDGAATARGWPTSPLDVEGRDYGELTGPPAQGGAD
jgi:hypothetical protein